MGRGKSFSDTDIFNMYQRIKNGEKQIDVLKEVGISRQAYHNRIKRLGLKSSPKEVENKIEAIDNTTLTKITTINELASLLNLSHDQVYTLINPNKSVDTNVKRLSYLKNNSPEKFQEAIITMIVKHFKLTPIALIKALQKVGE